nr:integrase, catalytic region, zinc finger, CCHC-type, peptidase aspartic, catalytic [Tanacetum cinerariifolium]
MGYGDYHIGNVTISRVYYVEGLGHNLFSVGQFYDLNLDVAFRQQACFIHNLEVVDLLTGSQGNNMYTLSLGDMMASSPICLLSKASKTKSWLWHRRLSHLNFGAINHLSRHGLVRDNGTKFVNQTLREYYEKFGISHETSDARSSQQNGVIKRRNHTLIKVACTTLLYAKTMLFLWAKAVTIACYTQNRSIIRLRHDKTPYELLHGKIPDLSFFHVFGALCYPTNDSENLGKLQPKADSGIFIGYAPIKKAFRIYNRHTRRIIETIHPLEVITPIDDVVAPEPVESTGSPSLTTVDQDAPSASNSQTLNETQSPTTFLNGILRKEVYVSQLDAFVDKDNSNHVYKLKKALYGLKQAPRAWYDLLSKFLLSQKFSKGTVDPTLFIRRQGKDILHVQIYSKYALESLKKYGMKSSDPVHTPMVEKFKPDEDPQGKAIDPTNYCEMVGTLMYLIANRPDLTFDTLITRVAKILDEVHLEVCNYWDKGLLAGHQKGRKAL